MKEKKFYPKKTFKSEKIIRKHGGSCSDSVYNPADPVQSLCSQSSNYKNHTVNTIKSCH